MAANVEAMSSATKYARYIHQLLCSPPASTLLRALAINTKLSTIPGLTPALINNNLPCFTATDKGHMRRHRSNTASRQNVHNKTVANAPLYTIPRSLAKHANKYAPAIDIDEYCYSAIHPVTKETITQYRKLMKEPPHSRICGPMP
jgi:hypothetical protein